MPDKYFRNYALLAVLIAPFVVFSGCATYQKVKDGVDKVSDKYEEVAPVVRGVVDFGKDVADRTAGVRDDVCEQGRVRLDEKRKEVGESSVLDWFSGRVATPLGEVLDCDPVVD